MSSPDGGPVEQYLDDLYARLRCAPRDARRILAEAEDHLREAVTDGLAAGLTRTEAEEQAVSGFGSVRAVVRAHDRAAGRLPGRAVLFDLTLAGLKLGGIGALAVAASGLVALAMNLLFGPAAATWKIQLFADYPGFLLAILPPGAFLVLGLLIALKNRIDESLAERAKAQAGDVPATERQRVRVTGVIE